MSNENGNSARREALLGDRPGSYAIARHVRMSPMKVRRVVDLIRGMDVSEALTALKFAPQAASDPVYKVVASAAAKCRERRGPGSPGPVHLQGIRRRGSHPASYPSPRQGIRIPDPQAWFPHHCGRRTPRVEGGL